MNLNVLLDSLKSKAMMQTRADWLHWCNSLWAPNLVLHKDRALQNNKNDAENMTPLGTEAGWKILALLKLYAGQNFVEPVCLICVCCGVSVEIRLG